MDKPVQVLVDSMRTVKGCGAVVFVPYSGGGAARHDYALYQPQCDACLHLMLAHCGIKAVDASKRVWGNNDAGQRDAIKQVSPAPLVPTHHQWAQICACGSPNCALVRAAGPAPTPPNMLDYLQAELAKLWTHDTYSPAFCNNPVPHKDMQHALLHVVKAAGKLAAIIEEAEHGAGKYPTFNLYPQSELAKLLADLVICACRMASTAPMGSIALGAAVVDRINTKMGAHLAVPVTPAHHQLLADLQYIAAGRCTSAAHAVAYARAALEDGTKHYTQAVAPAHCGNISTHCYVGCDAGTVGSSGCACLCGTCSTVGGTI